MPSTAYAAYRAALLELQQLEEAAAGELTSARLEHERSAALAAQADVSAEERTHQTEALLGTQLAFARDHLDRIGKADLIPIKVRPSKPTSATRADLEEAERSLAQAVERLRLSVNATVKEAAENARREAEARRAADATRARARERNQLLLRLAAGAAALLALVIVILVLTTH